MNGEHDLETRRVAWSNEKGQTTNIPALDPRWCEEKEFPLYSALKSMENVIVEPWCANMTILIQRCKWLLKLKFHKFWSFVVYGDKSFHDMLDSYLLNCPRYSEPFLMNLTFFSAKQKVSDLQNGLHRLIFLIFVRMAARKAGEDVISAEFHSKLIYENYLFDVPRMMDLCALYGQDNERMVQKIIEQVFRSQPKFYVDLNECAAGLITLFEKCEKSIETRVGEKVQLLNSRSTRYDNRVTFDAIYYLVDVVYSLSCFVKFCPKSIEIFHENGLTHRLPALFENTVPILYDAVLPVAGARFNKDKNMLGRLAYFEKTIVQLFRELVCVNSFAFLVGKNQSKNKTNEECLDDFLNSVSFVIHEKHFTAVYNEKHPFAGDVKLLQEKHIEIDAARLNYFTEAFSSTTLVKSDLRENENPTAPSKETQRKPAISADTAQHILDIFPHLTLTMIEKCLSYYDGNVENTVIALANDNLPRELQAILNNEQCQSSSSSAAVATVSVRNYEQESSPDVSKQVDDDEKYLVPLASSKKRGLQTSLEDKNAIKDLRAVYERYQFETPDEDDENAATVGEGGAELKQINVYDDEYDDTYDEHNVNVEGDTLADEMIDVYYRGSKSNVVTNESEEAATSVDAKGAGEGGERSWKGNYTGGRDRQNKERHKGQFSHHNRKDRALYKHSRGFGFY